MSKLIRVWKELSAEDISKHLLIVGASAGDCSNCKELGISYATAKSCPNCKTQFKYICSRAGEIKKIKQKRPDLIFIDFEDYKKSTGFSKAQELLGF